MATVIQRKVMKYIYQTIQADINDDVIYAGDFFATKESAREAIIKDTEMKEDINPGLHRWRSCKFKQGKFGETWLTYELVKITESHRVERRHGFITHKLYE